MSPTRSDQEASTRGGELARATLWFDDRQDLVVVTIDWSEPDRQSERLEFERLQAATDFLERNEFRPMPQHTSIWILEAPPENVVCIDEWRQG